MIPLPSYLTPAVGQKAAGTVHSVFDEAANLMLDTDKGPRMITLIGRDLPRVPDSIRMPRSIFTSLNVSEECALDGDTLILSFKQYALGRADVTRFRIGPNAFSRKGIDEFMEFTSVGSTGLENVPSPRREEAVTALCSQNAPDFIGLGPGLTPSFDDACTGVMAVYAAAGQKLPYKITDADLKNTTDVSARYLRLAREGYFGEALIRLIDAMRGGGSVRQRALELEWIGATSGRDILFGMRQAVIALELA